MLQVDERQLARCLAAVVDGGILKTSGAGAGLLYEFADRDLQRAARKAIPPERRPALDRSAADALVEALAEPVVASDGARSADIAIRIARHRQKAGQSAAAARAWRRAAEFAVAAGSPKLAVGCLDQAMAISRSIPVRGTPSRRAGHAQSDGAAAGAAHRQRLARGRRGLFALPRNLRWPRRGGGDRPVRPALGGVRLRARSWSDRYRTRARGAIAAAGRSLGRHHAAVARDAAARLEPHACRRGCSRHRCIHCRRGIVRFRSRRGLAISLRLRSVRPGARPPRLGSGHRRREGAVGPRQRRGARASRGGWIIPTPAPT